LPPLFALEMPEAAPSPNLPRFDQYALPDPRDLGERLERAHETADAVTALKALGLIQDEAEKPTPPTPRQRPAGARAQCKSMVLNKAWR
jgi:hypothetical protein